MTNEEYDTIIKAVKIIDKQETWNKDYKKHIIEMIMESMDFSCEDCSKCGHYIFKSPAEEGCVCKDNECVNVNGETYCDSYIHEVV